LITDPNLADVTKILLILHVIAAIIAIGPISVAASMFPAAARSADPARVGLLVRICRVYAVIGLAVPVFGFATASSLHVLGSPWVLASIGLTALAAAVLAFVILPAQDRIAVALWPAGEAPEFDPRAVTRVAGYTGLFNLLWASVTVLMILRPGSTTGV
jgi:uncharacterized membrane protein